MNPLESSQVELERLLGQRAELDRKIEVVRQAIELFEPVYSSNPSPGSIGLSQAIDEIGNLGITAAIERVLMIRPNSPLPPTAIRDRLVEAKFNLVGDNPLASIHQVLKRLVAKNGPIVVEEIDGQTMYKYDTSRVSRIGLYPSRLPARSFPVEAPERINAVKKAGGSSEIILTPPPGYQPPRYKDKK